MPAPNISTSVEDQSTRVSSQSGVFTAIVVAAKKGPINTPILTTGQTDFLRRWTPNERLEIGWDMALYEAYKYLQYQGNLYVVRACASDALYGGCVVKLSDSQNESIALSTGLNTIEDYTLLEDDAFLVYGSSKGAFNNDLSIIVVTDQEQVKLEGAFLLKVYKNKNLVETHTVSLDPSLKNGYGNNCYIETVLQSSNYIRAFVNVTSTGLIPKEQTKLLSLAGGNDGSAVTDGDRIIALKTLSKINDIDLQLIMDGGNTTPAYQKAIDDICKVREDSCHGILSTPYEVEVDSDKVNAIKNYRKEELNLNTYSCCLYTPHQEMYDEFNDRYIITSPGCYVAALKSQYATQLGWHWAVAGYTRGIVPSTDVVATFEPTELDVLSDNQINPIIKDPGEGNIIFDELTLYSTACDLQDEHISAYVNIYLRPALKKSLKKYLFEFNDDQTRDAITKMVDTFMQPEQSRRAVYAYRIVCDETNNTASDIQNNVLNVWLFIKPTKISKFIKQKIIITPYSVDLESIEI